MFNCDLIEKKKEKILKLKTLEESEGESDIEEEVGKEKIRR